MTRTTNWNHKQVSDRQDYLNTPVPATTKAKLDLRECLCMTKSTGNGPRQAGTLGNQSLEAHRSHRIGEVGRELWRWFNPSPLLEARSARAGSSGPCPAEPVCLQGWRLHNSLGSLQHPGTLTVKRFNGISVFHFMPISSCPFNGHHWEESEPFFVPLLGLGISLWWIPQNSRFSASPKTTKCLWTVAEPSVHQPLLSVLQHLQTCWEFTLPHHPRHYWRCWTVVVPQSVPGEHHLWVTPNWTSCCWRESLEPRGSPIFHSISLLLCLVHVLSVCLWEWCKRHQKSR